MLSDTAKESEAELPKTIAVEILSESENASEAFTGTNKPAVMLSATENDSANWDKFIESVGDSEIVNESAKAPCVKAISKLGAASVIAKASAAGFSNSTVAASVTVTLSV